MKTKPMYLRGDMQNEEDRLEVLKTLAEGRIGKIYIEYDEIEKEEEKEGKLEVDGKGKPNKNEKPAEKPAVAEIPKNAEVDPNTVGTSKKIETLPEDPFA